MEIDWCVGGSTGAVSLPQKPWQGRPQPLLACPQWWGDHPFLCPCSPSWSSFKRVSSTCTLELTPDPSCLFPNSTQRLLFPLSFADGEAEPGVPCDSVTITELALSTMGKPNFLSLFFHILIHYGLLQDIEHSSLCYPVGPYCLCILNVVACIYHPKLPGKLFPASPTPRQSQVCSCVL